MFSTLGQINHYGFVSHVVSRQNGATHTHQLGQSPSGSKPNRKTRSRKDPIYGSRAPRWHRLCILGVGEAQQQRVYVYLDPSEYLHLAPTICQKILLRSPIICAIKSKLIQGVCGGFENHRRWIHGRHTVNCSVWRKVQSGLAVFPTSGPVNTHLQAHLNTGTGPAFLRVRNHHKKTRPSSVCVPRNARCLECQTTPALEVPVSARSNPGMSATFMIWRKRNLPQEPV